ncbi:MAG: CheR family methyltransferase [Ktedonobacterales bacterium]
MGKSLEKPQLYDLVVMGASAGGIEALSILVATLPPTLPVPIVIAQHLDPSVPSHLGHILARRSNLPVRTVGEAAHQPERLESGTIYVVPADRDVEIADGTVSLQTGVGQHPMPSIDRLFTTSAKVYGERIIAVILTGSGSDGTAGARAVKAAGGTVVIENPQTASYPAMPASLPPTSVDVVVDLERMGPLIADLISGAQMLAAPPAADTLPGLLEQVRQHTGIDFSQYKSPTILRRLYRRIVATGGNTLHDYLQVLQEHPEEYQRLVASFLINVTEFFRDPALFSFMREQILPDLIAHARARGAPHEVRIWSAGCSTGEEAYSIAILLAEVLGPDVLQFTIRIFATDADTDAVFFARRGWYPAVALTNIPDELRTRYFTQVESGYEVAKAIRSMVIFGEHDLGQRAPFPHMDLVVCRNVLIYFTSELQLRALQLFAFSLRDGGYLVLGNAESASVMPNHFGLVHPRFKVYRRQGERVLVPPVPIGNRNVYQAEQPPAGETRNQAKLRLVPNGEVVPSAAEAESALGASSDLGLRVYTSRERFADQILSLPVGVVVVDRNYDVLTINSAAYALFDIHRPAIGKDLLHLAERVPTKPLRAAIDETFETPEVPAAGAVMIYVELEQEDRHVLQVTCYPYRRTVFTVGGGTSTTVEAVVLFISEITATPRSQELGGGEVAPQAMGGRVTAAEGLTLSGATEAASAETIKRLTEQLEAERARTRELRLATQELREGNDGLRRANEDLLVTKEEVQASSEETKTLNEEVQATNEELETLNEELEATVEELHTTNDDLMARSQELQTLAETREAQSKASERERAQLEAILSGMGDAVLAVDAVGKHVLVNDTYRRLFENLDAAVVIGDELGQPLPPEAAPWRRLGEGQPFRMAFSLHASDGARQWYEATGQPISSGELELGAVLTIHDVSDRSMRSAYERFLAQVSHELTTPLTSLMTTLQLIQRRQQAASITPDNNDQLFAFVARARRQASQLSMLVGDLADLERVQRDRLQLNLEPVDLVVLARRVVDDLALAQPTGQLRPPVVVRAEQETTTPIRVVGDTNRLEQVLRNLLQNALKYAPASDRIDVRVRRVQEREVAEMAELEVQDYGPGIPEAEQPLIFTPFYQVPAGETIYHEGLGLGLYIVQQLVQAHGGKIDVRSPEGRGTVFTIRLPLETDGSLALLPLPATAESQETRPPPTISRPRRKKDSSSSGGS